MMRAYEPSPIWCMLPIWSSDAFSCTIEAQLPCSSIRSAIERTGNHNAPVLDKRLVKELLQRDSNHSYNGCTDLIYAERAGKGSKHDQNTSNK